MFFISLDQPDLLLAYPILLCLFTFFLHLHLFLLLPLLVLLFCCLASLRFAASWFASVAASFSCCLLPEFCCCLVPELCCVDGRLALPLTADDVPSPRFCERGSIASPRPCSPGWRTGGLLRVARGGRAAGGGAGGVCGDAGLMLESVAEERDWDRVGASCRDQGCQDSCCGRGAESI